MGKANEKCDRPYIRLKNTNTTIIALSIILAGKEFQSLTALMKKEFKQK